MERDPFLLGQEQRFQEQQQQQQQHPHYQEQPYGQHTHPHLMKDGSLTDEQAFALMHPHQPHYPSSPPLPHHHHQLLPGATGGESGGGVVLVGGGGGPNSNGTRSESGGYRLPDIRAGAPLSSASTASMMSPPRSGLTLGYPSPIPAGATMGSRSEKGAGSVVNYPLDQGAYYAPYSPPQQHQQQLQAQALSIQSSGYSPYLHSQQHPSPYDETPFGSHYSLVSGSSSSVAGGYPRHQQQQYAMQPLKEKGSTGGHSSSGHGHYTQAPLVDLSGSPTPILRSASLKMEKASGKNQEGKEDDETSEAMAHRDSSDALSKGQRNQDIDQSSDDDDEEEGQERGASRRRDSKRCWCCSKRLCVYLTFLMVILLAIALYFLVPRAPGFSFVTVTSMGDPVVSKNQFQEPFSIQISVDNTENYLPLRLNSIGMSVWMKIDMTKVGNNDDLPSAFTLKAKQIQTISVPMVFDYTSLKIDTNSDGTFQQLITSCTPVAAGGTPVGLNLVFGGQLYVWGLSWVWKPQFSFNTLNIPCPINAKDPATLPLPSSPASPSQALPSTASVTRPAASGASSAAVATASAQGSRATASATPTQAAHS
ncbi:hypothetical protein EMPS_05140 [Entomortierella parvispora]|uniref:Late embryogenesis abundant protein LEA-2 subgroup domain-containing protein n=1 Tax=Entomortierella parvispora TaxID=205924 RepID=A0A9P3HAK8_9FUNG|nr:hypothetical protein EMPS_05140 [Entomortierella parvispora]